MTVYDSLGHAPNHGSLATVIPFLVITSVLNLALGYALSVYLGGNLARATFSQEATPSVALPAGIAADMSKLNASDFVWPTDSAAAAPAGEVHPATQNEEEVSAVSGMGMFTAEDKEVQTRTAAMEQDLLAGIEEFRNQLAQLKTKGAVIGEVPVVA